MEYGIWVALMFIMITLSQIRNKMPTPPQSWDREDD